MADGGEFLLHLLRNPPQHNPRQPSPRAPPAQALPDDPAVAAVGPTISYPPPLNQSKDLDHLPYRPPWSNSPPHFAPHSFFLQNPNPNLPSASALRPGFDKTSDQLNHKLFDAEDVLKSGIFGKNPTSDSAHHQQVHSDLMFGSFHDNAGLSNVNINQLKTSDRDVGLPNKIQNGLEIGFQKSPENNRNRELNTHKFVDHGGNSRWAGTQVRRPPPGFSSNPRSVGKKSSGFEKNTSKGKSKVGGLNRRNVATDSEDKKERALGSRMYGETNLSVQLDSPGQPSGSNLHSVTASDIEKSLSELHGEVRSDGMRTDGAKVRTELEDLDEQIGTLVLENGSSENDDNKKQQNARDKDYRSDKRGKWILNQRMRSARRRIECRTDINQLNYPFLSIYESLIPSEEEKGKQKQLLALLEKHVNKEWPDARLYVYGSCANSFGFRKSDIDVCLAIEDTDVNKCEILLKLAEILQSDNLQNVQVNSLSLQYIHNRSGE